MGGYVSYRSFYIMIFQYPKIQPPDGQVVFFLEGGGSDVTTLLMNYKIAE